MNKFVSTDFRGTTIKSVGTGKPLLDGRTERMNKKRTLEELIALLNEPNWWDRAFCNEVVNGHQLSLEESKAKAQMEREGRLLELKL